MSTVNEENLSTSHDYTNFVSLISEYSRLYVMHSSIMYIVHLQ